MNGAVPIKYSIHTREIDKKINKFRSMSKDELAKLFNCSPEEVLFGDYIAKNTTDVECPYKVIVGFANFENSSVLEGKLEVIIGKPFRDGELITAEDGRINYLALSTKNSAILDCSSIKRIYGNWIVNNYSLTLGSVEYIYGALYLNNTDVLDTGKVKYVDVLSLENSKLRDLNIKHIGKLIDTTNHFIDNLSNVKIVDEAMFYNFSLFHNKIYYFTDRSDPERLIRRRIVKPFEAHFKKQFQQLDNKWINNNYIEKYESKIKDSL